MTTTTANKVLCCYKTKYEDITVTGRVKTRATTMFFLVASSVSFLGSIFFLAGFATPYWGKTVKDDGVVITEGLWSTCINWSNATFTNRTCHPPTNRFGYLVAVQVLESFGLVFITCDVILLCCAMAASPIDHARHSIFLNTATVLLLFAGAVVWVWFSPRPLDVSIYMISVAGVFYFVSAAIHGAECLVKREQDDEMKAITTNKHPS